MSRFMFSLNKELYFVPVLMILKCLKDVTDTELYRELMIGANDDPYRLTLFLFATQQGLFSLRSRHAYPKLDAGRSTEDGSFGLSPFIICRPSDPICIYLIFVPI